MEIRELQKKSKEIWGDEKLPLAQMIVRLGKVFGDICRWERNEHKDREFHTKDELEKEMGNLIFCSIKFCDELGFDPEECIQKAIKAQEKYTKEIKSAKCQPKAGPPLAEKVQSVK